MFYGWYGNIWIDVYSVYSTYTSVKKVEKQLPIALMISPVQSMPNSVLGPNSACLLDLSAQLQHLRDTSGASLAFSKRCCFPEGYLKIVTKHQNFNIQIVASLKLSPHLISVLVLLVISVVHQIASPCSKPMDLRLFSAQCLQPRWSPSHCLQPWAALTDALT